MVFEGVRERVSRFFGYRPVADRISPWEHLGFNYHRGAMSEYSDMFQYSSARLDEQMRREIIGTATGTFAHLNSFFGKYYKWDPGLIGQIGIISRDNYEEFGLDDQNVSGRYYRNGIQGNDPNAPTYKIVLKEEELRQALDPIAPKLPRLRAVELFAHEFLHDPDNNSTFKSDGLAYDKLNEGATQFLTTIFLSEHKLLAPYYQYMVGGPAHLDFVRRNQSFLYAYTSYPVESMLMDRMIYFNGNGVTNRPLDEFLPVFFDEQNGGFGRRLERSLFAPPHSLDYLEALLERRRSGPVINDAINFATKMAIQHQEILKTKLPADKDLYAVLGVKKTAAPSTIKAAYRKLSRSCHPDTNPDDTTAEERFKQLGEAYEILYLDPEKRRLYDKIRSDMGY